MSAASSGRFATCASTGGLGVPRLVLPQLRRGLRLGDGFWYEGWEGCYDLVKLNLRNPAVVAYLLDTVRGWRREFGIDGLRLDVAYSLDRDFLRSLHGVARELSATAPAAAPLGGPRAEDTAFVLIGETLHGDYSQLVNPEMLDSCTNYECYKGLYSSFNSQNMFEIAHSAPSAVRRGPLVHLPRAPSALICRQPRCDPFGEYPHRPCLRAGPPTGCSSACRGYPASTTEASGARRASRVHMTTGTCGRRSRRPSKTSSRPTSRASSQRAPRDPVHGAQLRRVPQRADPEQAAPVRADGGGRGCGAGGARAGGGQRCGGALYVLGRRAHRDLRRPSGRGRRVGRARGDP